MLQLYSKITYKMLVLIAVTRARQPADLPACPVRPPARRPGPPARPPADMLVPIASRLPAGPVRHSAERSVRFSPEKGPENGPIVPRYAWMARAGAA
ncbi:hypothetical protein [Bifidobacterium vespertilionis]|uniref:hypothetical protein n=1 Tax=Bifidobacterium vespertilionis TaxID=2562524 RepID=UPI001BDC9BCA|nr:hypothetical protein [Bifidobacterium vespertilionis]MBT1180263.1 hypothetical protein [Bifidobacterium vespertilionis]